MNSNLDIRDGQVYWTGIRAEELTYEQLLYAFKRLAFADWEHNPPIELAAQIRARGFANRDPV